MSFIQDSFRKLHTDITEILIVGTWISLHSADPDGNEESNQESFEISTKRTFCLWRLTGRYCWENHNELKFEPPFKLHDDDTVNFVGCGLEETGAGLLVLRSPLVAPLRLVKDYIIPTFSPGGLTLTFDFLDNVRL